MKNLSVSVFLALVFCFQEDASAQKCKFVSPELTRLISALRIAGYGASCGDLRFDYVPGEGCLNGAGQYAPNPSTCYGSLYVPGPNGSTEPSLFYQLQQDEALLVLGVTPPPVHYFGFQSYVYARRNPAVPVTDARAWVDLYAGIGPAINQRTALGVKAIRPGLQEVFSDFAPILTTSSKRTEKDVLEKAIPFLLNPQPTPADVIQAYQMTNIERLANDLLKLGVGEKSDLLNSFLRVTPFKNSLGQFDPLAVSYLRNPQTVVLRIYPLPGLSPAPQGPYYLRSDVPMPVRDLGGSVHWEKALLQKKGVTSFDQTWQALRTATVRKYAAQGLDLVGEMTDGRGVYRGATIEGRYCLDAFEQLVKTQDADVIFASPRCLADSSDAAYISMTAPTLKLPPGGVIAISGVNHAEVGFGTYSNIALQKPTVTNGSLLHTQYKGSVGGLLPAAISDLFYSAQFKSICEVEDAACVEVPVNTELFFAERNYLNPETGTKPYYGDMVLPQVLVFAPRAAQRIKNPGFHQGFAVAE